MEVNIVPFLNLAAQYESLRNELLPVVEKTLSSGHYILGCNVAAFEQELAQYIGVRFGIGVNSGSDALTLALRALDIGPGDEVITSPFTYIAPAEAIHQVGAKVVFADIDARTFNLDWETASRRLSARTKAIIPVHLFGQAAAMKFIQNIAQARGLYVIEDCAQAIGATQDGHAVGSLGNLSCFSFYPTKNLGANGDGGMVMTNDEAIAKKLKMLRVHGIERRYHHDLHGYNSRLDELQAAILRVKLPRLNQWNERRVKIAQRYMQGLKGLRAEMPVPVPGNTHVYHVFAILVERRDELQEFLADRGIPTIIYYPQPLHLQPVYRDLGYKPGDFPVAEAISKRILPLPMYPELTDQQVDYVTDSIKDFFGKK